MSRLRVDPVAGLNPVQRDAVLHGEGPLLLLAGAGSGKTRVVTRRIARLLADGAPPESILALTFTNRAAREMRERVLDLLGLEDEPRLQIGTFHALGARFLRRHAEWFGRTRAFTIYDEGDQLTLVRDVVLQAGHDLLAPEVKLVRRAIDRAKNAGHSARDLGPELPIELQTRLDATALGEAYDQRLEQANAFDFGDLIVRPAQLLAAQKTLRERYRAAWRWILVDEFQDTNAAQYLWLRQIAPADGPPPGPNLFVVGDDDQSIYGWRGAEVENILRFPDEYPGAQVVRLEQNYRSDRYILTAANEVIAHNRRRLGKSLWTDGADGMRVELFGARDDRAEARWIAGRVAELCRDEAYAPGDVAVLMRANHLSLGVEQSLSLLGIPYRVLRGRAFFDRAEVRDALAYARLLVNPDDEIALRRAINAPSRGLGPKTLGRVAALAARDGGSLWAALTAALDEGVLKGKAGAAVRAFMPLIEAHREQLGEDGRPLDEQPAADRLRAVLTETGFLTELKSDARLGEEERQRHENVEQLLSVLTAFATEGPAPSLAAYLENVKLQSEVDAADSSLGAVSLMTVHTAKGLEFPVVFVMGLEEGVFPHKRSIEADDVEEERRLCYVAITRARQRLCLTWARFRRGFGEMGESRASRFLGELPSDALEPRYQPDQGPRTARPMRSMRRLRPSLAGADELFSDRLPGPDFGGGGETFRPGMKVWHAQLGAGVVQRVRIGLHTTLTVDFPDIGTRTIAADYVSPYDG
ncbi:MAG: UvrD-helicase domain-containing protein [Myxococcales bacterium]|nr:UvrD-helicase domain-containing protein [Myxococcales bacterium]